MCSSRSRSPSTSRAMGIPVHFETTSATSSSVTELRSSFVATDVSPSASRFSSSGIRPYWISAIRARSPARRAVSSSRRARSSRSLAFCEPCSRAFSARHTSSRSAYSRSSSAMDSSIRPRRSPDAWSLSLARASRSILSWMSRRPSPIHLLRHRIDLHADAARRLVDEVDRLVGELPAGDVTVREGCGGDEGGIGDVHPVVDLVTLLQTPEDGDRVLDPRLVHEHGLETAFEGRVLLHVLAVLVQGGGPDAVQLAARERGLEHVAGIHRALRPTRSDHGVELVDEEHDPTLLLRQVVQQRLHALLELAAELRARDHRAHVE